MASDIQDHLSISTEDNDDVIVEPMSESSMVGFPPSLGNVSPEQLILIKTFPWMVDFMKLCQTEAGITNIRALERLMKIYHKQVIPSVRDCYSRPNRACKLKRVMADALFFFHLTYSDFKPPLEHSSYLAKMSDLMAMYMDMEIKTSRTGSESLPKIASKLTSSLHVYFGRSHDLILDTILKSKIISKNFWELSDLIFRRVLRDSPGPSVYILTYIRYILAFKMWKGIMKEAEDRKKISQLAAVKLSPPPGFREKMSAGGILRDLLPKVPKARPDVTAFLMQAKFPVRDKIKMFLKAVQDPKLQCILDRHNFNAGMASTELEETESSTLMNDIWSSINIDTGIRDPLRSNFRNENKRKLKNITKVKVENIRKKRKRIDTVDEIGEDDKPICDTVILDDDGPETNFIKMEVQEAPRMEQVEVPPVCSEPLPESVVSMDIAAEVELSTNLSVDESDASVKLEAHSTYPKEQPIVSNPHWNETDLQTYYNNVNFEYLADNCKEAEYKNADYVNCKEGEYIALKDGNYVNCKEDEYINCKEAEFANCKEAEYVNCKEAEYVNCKEAEYITCKEAEYVTCKEAEYVNCKGVEYVNCKEAEYITCKEAEYVSCKEIDYATLKETDYVVVTEPTQACNIQPAVYEVLQEETEQIDVVNESVDVEKVCTSNVELVPSSQVELSEELKVAKAMSDEDTEDGTKSIVKDLNLPADCDGLGLLHAYTIKSDIKMYEFQMKVYSYSSKLNTRTWVDLLSPVFHEQSKLKMYRCYCVGCKNNLSVIRRNWKSVMAAIMLNSQKCGDDDGNAADENGYTYEKSLEDLKAVAEGEKGDILYWEAEIKDLMRKLDETVKEDSESSSLPLKKRKAFSYTPQEEKQETSYPSTPMISIAELVKDKLYTTVNVSHAQDNTMVPNYVPPIASHPMYPSTVIVPSATKAMTPEPTVVPEQTLVPGAYTTTFLPVNQEQDLSQRRTFITPAQLKEYSTLSAAQNLINFANTSRSFSDPPPNKKRTRKVGRQSRKRKRDY